MKVFQRRNTDSGVVIVAVVDWIFSLFHICNFFFRLNKFRFSTIQSSLLPVYQGAWISLFAKHIVQMFVAASLFLCLKKTNTTNPHRSLLFTTQVWCLLSIVLLFFSCLDGILLSLASVEVFIKENALNFKLIVKSRPSQVMGIHAAEIIFRIIGLFMMNKFVLNFFEEK